MNIGTTLTIILGLALFEIVSSIDNAVINAEVLATMRPKSRRWFLLWGLLIAVVLVRGLLPALIVWFATPGFSLFNALTATAQSSPAVLFALGAAAPTLLISGGTFLVLLFTHWLFLEEKSFGLRHERFFHRHGVWFYAIASLALAGIVHAALGVSSLMAFGAVVGSTAFFITHGFKQSAELAEEKLVDGSRSNQSDLAKLLYLEVIDTTFSIDGVLGAFAFTLSVPLILLGNGIGALVVRKLTVSNIERIKQLKYLKNGAMYSILGLGCVMLAQSFGAKLPEWISPIITVVTVGFFYWKSVRTASLK